MKCCEPCSWDDNFVICVDTICKRKEIELVTSEFNAFHKKYNSCPLETLELKRKGKEILLSCTFSLEVSNIIVSDYIGFLPEKGIVAEEGVCFVGEEKT